MIQRGRKAVAPIVTTILLILITIVLASIIILWGTTFLPEALSKFDSPIESACDNLKFTAELSAYGTEILVVNTQDVPIYKFGIKLENQKMSEISEQEANLGVGSSATLPVDTSAISSGDSISLIPILLGKTDNGKFQEFSCPEQNWMILTF